MPMLPTLSEALSLTQRDNKESPANPTSHGVSSAVINTEKSYGLLDLMAYSALVYACYKAVASEHKDMYSNGDSKLIGDGHGKYYYKGKKDDKDTVETLLDKINILADTSKNTVKWRRCLILGTVSALIVSLLTFNRFPTGKQFFMILLPIFGTFYASFNYYEYHYDRYPREYIHENTKQIGDNFVKFKKNLTEFIKTKKD